MSADAFLPYAKIALRVKTNTFDEMEIMPIIEAGVEDLKRSGVVIPEKPEENASIIRAVQLYVKWQFGYNDNAARHQGMYTGLRNALALALDTGKKP